MLSRTAESIGMASNSTFVRTDLIWATSSSLKSRVFKGFGAWSKSLWKSVVLVTLLQCSMAVTFREANSFGGEVLCEVFDCKRNQNQNLWWINYFLFTICKYDPKTYFAKLCDWKLSNFKYLLMYYIFKKKEKRKSKIKKIKTKILDSFEAKYFLFLHNSGNRA